MPGTRALYQYYPFTLPSTKKNRTKGSLRADLVRLLAQRQVKPMLFLCLNQFPKPPSHENAARTAAILYHHQIYTDLCRLWNYIPSGSFLLGLPSKGKKKTSSSLPCTPTARLCRIENSNKFYQLKSSVLLCIPYSNFPTGHSHRNKLWTPYNHWTTITELLTTAM